jgi:hypothetical protein
MALSFRQELPGGGLSAEEFLVDPLRRDLPEPENHNFQLRFSE